MENIEAPPIWEEMLGSGIPFALIDVDSHVFIEANEEYARLFMLDADSIKGFNLLSSYPPEVQRSIVAMMAAFGRGTLDSIRGSGPALRVDGEIVELKGWTRRAKAFARPVLITSATEVDSEIEPDDRPWVARAPEVFCVRAESLDTSGEEVPSTELRVADVVISHDAFAVYKAGKEVPLTRIELLLLAELARNAGKVMPREHLVKSVWGYNYLGGSRLVDMAIYRLRHKIEDDPTRPKVIITVRGVGYRIPAD